MLASEAKGILQEQWKEEWLDNLAESTINSRSQSYSSWPEGLPSKISLKILTETGEALTVAAQRGGRSWSFKGAGGYTPQKRASSTMGPGMFSAPLRFNGFATINEWKDLWNSLEDSPNVNLFSLPRGSISSTLHSGLGRPDVEVVSVTPEALVSSESKLPSCSSQPPQLPISDY